MRDDYSPFIGRFRTYSTGGQLLVRNPRTFTDVVTQYCPGKTTELVALPELEKTKIPIRRQEMQEKVLEEVVPVEVIIDEDSY
jgi:hypothetical protein